MILQGKGLRDNIVLDATGAVAKLLLYNDQACTLLSVTARTAVAGGTGLKLTLGYVTGTQAPASATSVTATGGELDLTVANANRTLTIKARPGDIMPKGSWLAIKSVAGTTTGLDGCVLSIVRRRLAGTI